MIAVVHYTDENLIAMLEAGDEEAIRRNPHLASCDVCRQSLDEYRAIVGVLGDEAAWDYQNLKSPDPDPSTVAVLRGFATSMAREDEEAVEYVTALLEGPRDTWMPRLRAHPEWRTAGVVRKLVGDAYAALTRMPPDGVEMTALAIEISDHLPEDTYPSDTVTRLRGHAWREHAYGLFYVGEFKQSLAACDRADAELSRCKVDEYDRARVGVVRALSLRPLDEVGAARTYAIAAEAAFQAFGDRNRVVTAALTVVRMDFKIHDYGAALRRLLALSSDFWDALDNNNRFTLAANIGFCYRELGRFDEAIAAYERASTCAGAKSITESVRIRWNIATLLTRCGRLNNAVEELRFVRSEFDRLQMQSESVLVGLELAELLLIEHQSASAESLCRELCGQIEAAGLSSTSRAMAALAFLQEALAFRKATPKLVRQVRNYVERLPEEPNLLFAPPPL